MAADETGLSSACDSILKLDSVVSCTVFDAKGRRLDTKVRAGQSSDFLGKYGGVIGSVILGGLKSVESFGGKLNTVVATFESLKIVATVADSGVAAIVCIPLFTDAEYIRRMVRSELLRVEVESSWSVQKTSR